MVNYEQGFICSLCYLQLRKRMSLRGDIMQLSTNSTLLLHSEHERIREFLFPEGVHKYLQGFVEFEGYSMDALQQDLD